MTQEEAGSVILEIFRRECDQAGDCLTNKVVHNAYFKKTESTLGFFEGVNWLVQHKWLVAMEGQENCHRITKSGWKTDI